MSLSHSGVSWKWLVPAIVASCGAPQTSTRVEPPIPLASASSSAIAASKGPCELAAAQRERMPGLVGEGRIHRALDVIVRANKMCPAQAPRTWAAQIQLLAELGRHEETAKLAQQIHETGTTEDKAAATIATALLTERAATRPIPDLADGKPRPKEILARETAAKRLRAEAKGLEKAGDLRSAKEKYFEAWTTWHPWGEALYDAARMATKLGDRAQAQRWKDRAVEEIERETGESLSRRISTDYTPRRETFSADDTVMAGSGDWNAFVVDTATWRERARFPKFPNHRDDGVALSPDGRRVAVLGDGGVHIWDVESGRLLLRIEKDTGSTTVLYSTLLFSSDGRWLAVDVNQAGIDIYDSYSGKIVRTLLGLPGLLAGMSFSNDGALFAAGCRDKSISVWDTSSGKLRHTLIGHTGEIISVAASPSDTTLASIAEDNTIRLWDISTGKQKWVVRNEPRPEWVEFSAGGRELIVALAGSYEVRDASRGAILRMFDWSGTISSNLPPNATSHEKLLHGGLCTGDEAHERSICSWVERRDPAGVAAWSPSSKRLAFEQSGVQLWDVGSGKTVRRLGGDGAVNGLFFSADEQILRSGSYNGDIKEWDVISGNARPNIELDRDGSHMLYVYPTADGKIALTARDSGLVKVWDIDSRKQLSSMTESPHNFSTGLLSSDGLTIGYVDSGIPIRLWDSLSATLLPLPYGAYWGGEAISSDGALLVALADRYRATEVAKLWDVRTGKVVRTLERSAELCRSGFWSTSSGFGFSRDNKLVAMGSPSVIPIWDVASGALLRTLPGPGGNPAFSPDGKWLAADAPDGTVQIWRGEQTASLGILSNMPGGYILYSSGHLEVRDVSATDLKRINALSVCRFGRLSFPFDLCSERYTTVPAGTLAAWLKGDESAFDP